MKLRASSCTVLAFLAFSAPAWAAKVQICHVPPGNPANFHTITVNENALQAHLGHGDLLGTCFAHCDQLCDDGNACTIDACDAAEQCLVDHPPVSCNDSNLCTLDSCNPATGCESTPKVCLDGALCTVDACDPLTGNCAFPPVACPTGQTCNTSNGSCEGAPPIACPCLGPAGDPTFTATVSGEIPILSCQTDPGTGGIVLTYFPPPGLSEVILSIEFAGQWFCGISENPIPITPEEGLSCASLLEQAANSQAVPCVGVQE
jgi:hypothetical protein